MEGVLRENQEQNRIPTLLLHSCCAPCSSYVLEYLSEYFFITVYYYNPNIYPDEETCGGTAGIYPAFPDETRSEICGGKIRQRALL